MSDKPIFTPEEQEKLLKGSDINTTNISDSSNQEIEEQLATQQLQNKKTYGNFVINHIK